MSKKIQQGSKRAQSVDRMTKAQLVEILSQYNDKDTIEVVLPQSVLPRGTDYSWWSVKKVDSGFEDMAHGESCPLLLELGVETGAGYSRSEDIRDFSFEKVTAEEFILADIDHAKMLHDFCVEIINLGNDNFRVYIHSNDAQEWTIVVCENTLELLAVLELGEGICTPHFYSGTMKYFEDFFDHTFTFTEREVWISYLIN